MHFCYGLGAFVSPMIAEPFLLNEDCSPLIKEEENNPLNISMRALLEPSVLDMNTTSELYPADTLAEAQEMTQVKYAFWIMCAMQVSQLYTSGDKIKASNMDSSLEELV